MNTPHTNNWALTAVTVSALLVACGGSQLPIGAPQSAMVQSRSLGGTPSAQTQGLSFPDGLEPDTRLVAFNGKLYGTTRAGGANNQGTVYRITTAGTEKVLHSFATGCQKAKKCSDGAIPTGLAYVDGTLYGTTGGGGLGPCKNPYGPNGCGTLFSLTTRGTENVLYSFGSGCVRSRGCATLVIPTG